jgi:hypothetical protein
VARFPNKHSATVVAKGQLRDPADCELWCTPFNTNQLDRRRFVALGLGAMAAGCAPRSITNDGPESWKLQSPDTAGDRGGGVADTRIPWRLVAESDLIVRATLRMPKRAASALERRDPTYVSFPLTVSKVYKGDPPVHATQLQYYPARTSPLTAEPTPEAVAAVANKEAIFFLVLPYEGGADGGPLYFAGYTRSALLLPSSEIEQELSENIAQQAALAARVAEFLAIHHPPFDQRAAALIENLLKSETANQAADGLLSLGPDAIPALIRRIDDRRRLALGSISVPTGPGGFEGLAHYKPKEVIDFISLVVALKAHEGVESLPNGGTAQARSRVVDGWRVWLGRAMQL